METIPKNTCEKIGFFRKTHGVHGEVVLEFETAFEYSVEEAVRFFVELEGLLVPFFIADEGLRFRSGNAAIVKFDGVDTEAYAKRLIGQSAWLYKTEIVDDQDEESTLPEGFILFDQKHGKIGTIERIDDFAGNVVLTVRYQGEELLIPYSETFVVERDNTHKTLTLNLPEGLINV